ncbi:hypothetical protein BgAZ_500810 [Babesia gibsoni]|uniref:Uncharacterized protein n=1 Tax=Babesia gibsoni TaxID=33632 RepID=A0AAD8LGG4_BABGI|nr:hypothetical protein BgAZ_500810 [Babesia gibsoni]
MLILGNKYRKDIQIDTVVGSSSTTVLKPTPELITNAPRNYDLILCLDPVLYARQLYNINLPCVAVCKVEELYKHRDIPDAFDYIIPLGHSPESNFLDLIKAESPK